MSWGLRRFVGGSNDAQTFQTASKRVGMDVQDAGRAARTVDDPTRLTKHGEDVVLLDGGEVSRLGQVRGLPAFLRSSRLAAARTAGPLRGGENGGRKVLSHPEAPTQRAAARLRTASRATSGFHFDSRISGGQPPRWATSPAGNKASTPPDASQRNARVRPGTLWPILERPSNTSTKIRKSCNSGTRDSRWLARP